MKICLNCTEIAAGTGLELHEVHNEQKSHMRIDSLRKQTDKRYAYRISVRNIREKPRKEIRVPKLVPVLLESSVNSFLNEYL